MQAVLTAISTVGFPIVAFLLMFYQGNKTIKDSTKGLKENTEILKELCIQLRK